MILRQNSIVIAPMAGVTDRAFREICMEYGGDLCFTEMVSTKGLFYNDKKTASLLENSPAEKPIYAQIFGHEPQMFENVIKKIVSFGVDGIDINCGCPAKKIISNNDGGALLKKPELIYDLVCAVKENCSLPVSVKLRTGWDENHINILKSVEFAQKAGVSHITIHARNVKQGYTGKANLDLIKEAVLNTDIPIIGNGDIKTPEDAKEMLEYTGCKAVMLGRGILGNPFLIKRTKAYILKNEYLPLPSDSDRISAAINHIKKIIKYKGENIGIKEARKHAIWYIKGIKGSVRIKRELTSAKTYVEMEELLTSLNEI